MGRCRSLELQLAAILRPCEGAAAERAEDGEVAGVDRLALALVGILRGAALPQVRELILDAGGGWRRSLGSPSCLAGRRFRKPIAGFSVSVDGIGSRWSTSGDDLAAVIALDHSPDPGLGRGFGGGVLLSGDKCGLGGGLAAASAAAEQLAVDSELAWRSARRHVARNRAC